MTPLETFVYIDGCAICSCLVATIGMAVTGSKADLLGLIMLGWLIWLTFVRPSHIIGIGDIQ